MACAELNGCECKTYLLSDGGEAALVDPLLERVDAYLSLLKKEGLRLKYVIDTHTHADHISGAGSLRGRLGADYVMGAGAGPRCVSRGVADGETLGLGRGGIRFLKTPGHTTDSVSLGWEDSFLSGDFLFIGSLGAGRLDLPGGDPADHFESLKKLDSFPDETRVCPGHDYLGAAESFLGRERAANPVLKASWRREAYIAWWNDKKFGPADWMREVVRANLACATQPGAIVIVRGVSACACASVEEAENSAARISAADLARLLAGENPPFVLDVREREEYDGDLGHIEGSHLIALGEVSARLSEIPEDRGVVLVCRGGARAMRAARILLDAGRKEIWVLAGGMQAWRDY